jgi:diguanylate cyclase (GGDEF)-like protein
MERDMSPFLRKVAAGCAVLLGMAVVGGAGGYLSSSQAATRESLLSAFDQRAQLTASLTGDTLLASDAKTRQWAGTTFGGSAAGLSGKLAASLDSSTPWLAVLDAHGAPIGVSSASRDSEAAGLREDAGFRLAMESGMLSFGDVVTEGGVPTVRAFQPYAAGKKVTRVLVVPTNVTSLGVLLRSAIDVTGSRSYVMDGAGRVIVTSTDARIGAPLPDRRLAVAADRRGRGTVGDDYFDATAVSGSDWRAVVVTSRAGLLTAVDRTARGAWLIFGAFAVAVLLILVIGASTLISSARLAHARRHDPLTGLPNRSLFLERTEAAVARWRRSENPGGDRVAVLFLDLDGFKPVNDTYGHAAGDAVLKEVARRLVAATRPDDYVSRFGGDEFLVLCRGLRDESDALAVAERIRNDLSQPFDVLGHRIGIGTSIGVAGLGEHADRAETLINNADVAVYRAKSNGRGIIERYAEPPTLRV